MQSKSVAVPPNSPPARGIIDPEALALTSLAMSPIERRLEDVVAAWSRAAAFLLSKVRFKRLAASFPEAAEVRLGDFARYAVEGGESRWRTWASPRTPESPPERGKRLGPLTYDEGPALTLRLRAGFGVNAKADLLAVRLGSAGGAMDLKLIAAATGYTERMVRVATREMTTAGFIHEIEGHPSSFFVEPEPWAHLLGFAPPASSDPRRPEMPVWRFWSAALGFLCHVSTWAQSAETGAWSDYVAGSRARDLYEAHGRRLRQAGIEPRPSARERGGGYLTVLQDTVDRVRDWVADGL